MKTILLFVLLPILATAQDITWTYYGWSNDVAVIGDSNAVLWGSAKATGTSNAIIRLQFSSDLQSWTNIFSATYTGQLVRCIIPNDTPGFVLPEPDDKEFYRWSLSDLTPIQAMLKSKREYPKESNAIYIPTKNHNSEDAVHPYLRRR